MMIFFRLVGLPALLVNFSAFLFFGFFLSVRSSYSWAMGLALVVSVVFWNYWRSFEVAQPAKVLATLFLVLAFFWNHSFDSWLSFGAGWDYFFKYAFGALCAVAVCAIGVRRRVLAYAIALGCISSGVLAICQFPVTGRADGYTNAIRFGNIALILAMASWLLVPVKDFSKKERLLFLIAGSLGLTASLLSLSRGGWILLAVAPLMVLFFLQRKQLRIKALIALIVVGASLVLAGLLSPVLKERVLLAKKEAYGYFENRDAYVNTSVGVRLEQWKMGAELGWEKPVTGWGVEGFENGKVQSVLSGRSHPSVLQIPHTHNEIVQIWASRGSLGLFFLFLIYFVPLYIFFPSKSKVDAVHVGDQAIYLSLHLIGLLIPVGYFVFGWTDVFFNLSIGHNFYIFSLIFILASIQQVRGKAGARCAEIFKRTP